MNDNTTSGSQAQSRNQKKKNWKRGARGAKKNFVQKTNYQAEIERLQGELDGYRELERTRTDEAKAEAAAARRLLEAELEAHLQGKTFTFSVPRQAFDDEENYFVKPKNFYECNCLLIVSIIMFAFIVICVFPNTHMVYEFTPFEDYALCYHEILYYCKKANLTERNYTCELDVYGECVKNFDRDTPAFRKKAMACKKEGIKVCNYTSQTNYLGCISSNISVCPMYHEVERLSGFKISFKIIISVLLLAAAFEGFFVRFTSEGFSLDGGNTFYRRISFFHELEQKDVVEWKQIHFQFRRKLRLTLSGIDVQQLELDLRTDDQQRVEMKHKAPLMMNAQLEYYQTRSHYIPRSDRLPTTQNKEYAIVRQRETRFYYEMFVQLIKHANTSFQLETDVVIAKMNQHASYLSSMNNNRYDIESHLMQDTVMLASLYYMHNRSVKLHQEVFQMVLI